MKPITIILAVLMMFVGGMAMAAEKKSNDLNKNLEDVLKELIIKMKKYDGVGFDKALRESRIKRSKDHDPKISPAEKQNLIISVRNQIERCWVLPAEYLYPKNKKLTAHIEMTLNKDGSVEWVRPSDKNRMILDDPYRVLVESVLRSIKGPDCAPFKLPLKYYEYWRDITLEVKPKNIN